MFGDPLQRFSSGDPLNTLRADTLNALVDSAKLVRAKLARGQFGANIIGYDAGPKSLEILIRNDTGADIPAWGVVRPGASLEDVTANPVEVATRPLFQGLTPTAGGIFAVVQEPIPEDGIGVAIIIGVALVNLLVTSTGDTYANCTTATDKLTTGSTGAARIIWKESGTGDKLGLVLMQDFSALRINTQNVDGTEVEADTRDIRFDQSTRIKVQQLTGPKRSRVYIDTAGLTDDIAPDIITLVQASGTSIEVVECVSLIENEDGSYSLEVKKRNLLVLEVGPEQDCEINPERCCPPPETSVPCCPNAIPETLSLTVSDGGGSYPATWDGTAWDTGLITIPGCGTARLRLSCEGTSAGDFVVGNIGTAQCVFSTGIGGTTVTCNPFSAQFVGTFSGIGCSCGSKTLTWTPPA